MIKIDAIRAEGLEITGLKDVNIFIGKEISVIKELIDFARKADFTVCFGERELEAGLYHGKYPDKWLELLNYEDSHQVFGYTFSYEFIEKGIEVFLEQELDSDFVNFYRIERNNNELSFTRYDIDIMKVSIERNWEVRGGIL